MISFACAGCGKQVKVKDELAGKQGKCPGCGQAITVPALLVHSAGPPAAEEAKKVEEKKGTSTLVRVLATVFGAVLAPVLVALLVKWADLSLWKSAPATQPALAATTQPVQPERTTDEQRLQGRWKCVKEQSLQKEWTPEELAAMDQWLDVNDHQLRITSNAGRAPGAWNGQFHLNPQASPKQFDWEGTFPLGRPHKMLGIYVLEGNRFRLCYRVAPKEKALKRPGWSDALAKDVICTEFEKAN